MSDPFNRLKAGQRAQARRKILGGVEGARRREQLAADLDDTRSWVDPNGYRLSDRLWNARQSDREQIDGLLRQSIAAADDPIRTARKLEQFLTPLGASQVSAAPRSGKGLYAARRLARTETTRAFGQGTIEAAKRSRFVTKIRWRLSGRYNPKIDNGQCADNVGEYYPEEVPRYPAHPNCRCTLLPIAEDPQKVAEYLRRQLDRDALEQAGVDPFNPPKPILDMERKLRAQRHESAAAFDNTGRQVLYQDGQKYEVMFTDLQEAQLKDTHFTHNHPRGWEAPEGSPDRIGNSFSPSDIGMFVKTDMASMRAVSPQADYTVQRPEDGFKVTYHQAVIEHSKVSKQVQREFTEAVQEGRLDPKEASRNHYHETMTRFAEQMGWKYERKIYEGATP